MEIIVFAIEIFLRRKCKTPRIGSEKSSTVDNTDAGVNFEVRKDEDDGNIRKTRRAHLFLKI